MCESPDCNYSIEITSRGNDGCSEERALKLRIFDDFTEISVISNQDSEKSNSNSITISNVMIMDFLSFVNEFYEEGNLND